MRKRNMHMNIFCYFCVKQEILLLQSLHTFCLYYETAIILNSAQLAHVSIQFNSIINLYHSLKKLQLPILLVIGDLSEQLN